MWNCLPRGVRRAAEGAFRGTVRNAVPASAQGWSAVRKKSAGSWKAWRRSWTGEFFLFSLENRAW